MTTPYIWKGRQNAIVVGTVISSPNTTTTKYAQITSTTSITSWIKDWTITPPTSDVEQLDMMGETSNFQNALWEEKPWKGAELTGTIVFSGMTADKGPEGIFHGVSGDTTNTSWKQFQFGSSASAQKRIQVAVGLRLTDAGGETQGSTDAVDICLNNAWCKLGDIKSSSDGHAEASFTAKCLPKDYYDEYQNA